MAILPTAGTPQPGLLNNIAGAMQSPAFLMGAGLLSNRPIEGLFQGARLGSQLESAALERDLRQQQILKAQQDQALAAQRRQSMQDIFGRTPLTGRTAQQMVRGQIPATTQSMFERDPQQAITTLAQTDPQAAISLMNAMKPPAEGTSIHILPDQKELEKGIGKFAAGKIIQVDKEAGQAVTANADLNRMLLLLDQGTNTGVGQDWKVRAMSLMDTLGLPVELTTEMGRQEVFDALGAKFSTMFRSPDSATGGLPGATSNKDLIFIQKANPGLAKTPEGNRLLINAMLKTNQMKMDARAFSNQLLQEGADSREIIRRMSEFTENYELFTPEEREAIERARTAGFGPRTEKKRMDPLDIADEVLQGRNPLSPQLPSAPLTGEIIR